ncbi:unnamed protein product [Bursaphelenchus okinawaensis]|uniref:Nuclear receptor domain-containing protein n=1 Tax=Bursaphelenchus okinawaensis TaxID=465554 RepID=A0A811LUG7_9BILA|nr:unnamed protein product [Bursaphelenchus okinawaensis]CAG9127874.1 unnamed protein product [Bursaphelenchus okinawaensis]
MSSDPASEENEHVDVESLEVEQYDCKICSAHATGFHFDAQSCSACAAFFRRAVSLGREYTCINGQNNCTILYTERALCRACRMQKCIKVGMKRESVQMPAKSKIQKTRSYYTQSGLRRNKRFGITELKLKNFSISTPLIDLPQIKTEELPEEDLPSCSSSQQMSQPVTSPESSISSPRACVDENLLKIFIAEEMKISERRRIMFCERPVASLVGQTKECCFTMSDIRPLKFRSFRKSIRTHLLLIYEWLRVWPAYHQFNETDKMTCFRKCALYHTLLDPCFISLQLKDRSKFVMQNGGYVSTNESDDGWEDEKEISRDNKKLIYWPLLNRIKSDILDQFFVLDLSFDEFVALKAIITMQMISAIPDVSKETKLILNNQVDNIIQCLHHNYPDSCGQLHKAERIGNIFMLLSPIFDTATNFVESHHQVQFFDIWQLDSLMLQFLQNKA